MYLVPPNVPEPPPPPPLSFFYVDTCVYLSLPFLRVYISPGLPPKSIYAYLPRLCVYLVPLSVCWRSCL